ncbi:cupin domain-containing protein, partial [Mesorhizobium sp. M4B.F.Ca.ET.203.01.1.1]
AVVLGEVVEGRDRVDAIDAGAVSDDVHTVTVHDDGIEVIVNFEDDEEDDSDTGRA